MIKKKELEKKYKPIRFNPSFKDFLKENPNISILKLSFALWWRLQLLILIIAIPVFILLEILIILLNT